MKYFIATDSRGHVFTRSSATRSYTWCVVAIIVADSAHYKAGSCVWLSWARSLKLAQDRTKGWLTRTGYELEILEAHEIDRKQYRDILENNKEHKHGGPAVETVDERGGSEAQGAGGEGMERDLDRSGDG